MADNLPAVPGFDGEKFSFAALASQKSEREQQMLKEIAAQQQFIPQIRLINASSKEIKTGVEGAKVGYFHFDGQFLKPPIPMVILLARTRGTRFMNGEAVETIYDPNDPKFIAWMNKRGNEAKDYAAGPEFLVWLPNQRAFGRLHLVRSFINNMGDFIRGVPLVLYAGDASSKGNEWKVPRAKPMLVDGKPLTPAQADEQLASPDPSIAKMMANKFMNPSDTSVVKEPEPEPSKAPPSDAR